jgi:hypothetical protein
MTGPDTPLRVNAQAGTSAMPRLVPTARVAGLAAVTSSGVVAQEGHCLLLVSSPKVRASLSTGTFMVGPPGQVTTPAGWRRPGEDEVAVAEVRLVLARREAAARAGGQVISREHHQAGPPRLRERRARPGDGLLPRERVKRPDVDRAARRPAVDMAAGADAGTPTPPADVAAGPPADELPALAAHPATATSPRQAASRENARRPTPTITTSREGHLNCCLDAARPATVPPHSRVDPGVLS